VDVLASVGGFFYLVQFFFAVVIGLYFWNLLKKEKGNKAVILRDSEKERDRLRRLRSISLTEPLSSRTRPTRFEDIVGQEEGLEALKAALCGPNPQHVIIYGPPGVGKTAAARLVLEAAKENSYSPFSQQAQFVEMDATICRFDERSIADPLIGSVHDPIYQGAGALGLAGIPQPKPGAVTKAHGGILFIDEIGELHPVQINKLLKVLEDRKVFLESAYYSPEEKNIPSYIHDIFQNGLPADFRLVGATTRNPEELPPAIRSRCIEVFFRSLEEAEIYLIARGAVEKIGMVIEEGAIQEITRFATNGREAVNMVQLAAGMAVTAGLNQISQEVVEKVLNNGRFTPRHEFKVADRPQVGVVNGLAVYGANQGSVIEIEACAIQVKKGKGRWNVTGVIEEEEFTGLSRTLKRKSMARGAVENALTALRRVYGLDPSNYDIHINLPGGVPVDGPSAGVAIATAIYSSIYGVSADNRVAMTGEVSVMGRVKPVGGVMTKIEAAQRAGIAKVIIPRDNWLKVFHKFENIEIVSVEHLDQVMECALMHTGENEQFPAKLYAGYCVQC
jgi:Lon-like ATP-dependent protease